MTNVLSPLPILQFFDNAGRPAAGYKLFTYAAGTSTKLATYQDETTGSPNANPTFLDFRGQARVWIPPNVAYKYVFAGPNDTDPPTAPIWTIDNIVNSQLVTLWGGVDTGIANAYVLDFTASFTAYEDGIVIYWLPSNSNTGPSTINVNGLGPVPITNQDGSDLYLGQIQANQVALIVYRSTGFTLVATALLPTINEQPNNYTFALQDANNIVENPTDDILAVYTIPTNADVAFPVGTSIEVIASGDAGITIDPDSGVTLNPYGVATPGTILVNGHASTVITKVGTNQWVQSTPSDVPANLIVSTGFTGNLTGMTSTIQGLVRIARISGIVTLNISNGITGTSNSTSMTMTGIPAEFRPVLSAVTAISVGMQDNGAQVGGVASVSTAGVITFGVGINNNTTGFTGSGFKGLQAGWTIFYLI